MDQLNKEKSPSQWKSYFNIIVWANSRETKEGETILERQGALGEID